MALMAELYSIPITDAGDFEPGRGGLLAWYRAPDGRGVIPGMPYYPEPASATKHNPEFDALLEVAQALFSSKPRPEPKKAIPMDVLYSIPMNPSSGKSFKYRLGSARAWKWLGPVDGVPHIGCKDQWYTDDQLPFFNCAERRALMDVVYYLFEWK